MECLITGHELREATARRLAVLGPEVVRVQAVLRGWV